MGRTSGKRSAAWTAMAWSRLSERSFHPLRRNLLELIRGVGPTQTKALAHPLRVRILEMHIRMKSRPPSLETMTQALGQTREYEGVEVAEVKYHRDCLLDAKLLPV
jgi:hypothetical protein